MCFIIFTDFVPSPVEARARSYITRCPMLRPAPPIGSLAVYLMVAPLFPWEFRFSIEAQRASRSGQKCVLRRPWSWKNQMQDKLVYPASRLSGSRTAAGSPFGRCGAPAALR